MSAAVHGVREFLVQRRSCFDIAFTVCLIGVVRLLNANVRSTLYETVCYRRSYWRCRGRGCCLLFVFPAGQTVSSPIMPRHIQMKEDGCYVVLFVNTMLRMLVSGVPKLLSWRVILCGVLIFVGQSATLSCQSTSVGGPAKPDLGASTYHPHLAFDVASIHEYRAEGGMRYVDDEPHNSLYHGEGVSLFGLIAGAYQLKLREQLVNLPNWADHTLYTIDARSDAATDEALAKLSDGDALAEKRHMLQVLLEERFHLQIHPETRTSSTYELITTARAAKLMTPVQGDVGKTVSTCRTYLHRDKGFEVDSKGCPFDIFFSTLEQNLGTDVLDRTGMTGMYAYHLMWWPAQALQGVPSEDRYPALKDAVREQLGLELKPTKGPVTFWVVDHIERPTPN